jgi:hypothetical protein
LFKPTNKKEIKTMAMSKERFAILDGSTASANPDRVIFGQALGVANASGAAGATVSTVVTFLEPLPSVYAVTVQPGQAAVAWITSRTAFGFTVNIAPLVSTNAISAGTFDATVIAA